MPLQISNISAVLKKVIIPTIQDQLAKESVFFDKVKRNSGVTITNNTIYIAARTNRHSGIYAVPEGTQPYTGYAAYAQPSAPMRYVFGSLELTDQAIEAASNSNDVKAIAAILSTEIKALKDDLRMDINRQMFGNGAGILCLANGSGSGGGNVTLIVDGNPNGGDGTEYLTPGMYIHINTGTAVQIVSVDSATQVTIATSVVWADNVGITKYEGTSRTGTGSSAEIMGLVGLIGTAGSIQGIDRTAYPWAQAQNAGCASTVTEAQMITVYLKTKRYGGQKVIFMGPTQFQAYGSLLTSMKKTADLKEVLSGGWKGLEFMDGAGVMLDFDCWSSRVEFVDFDSLTLAEMSEPFKWLEGDAHGGILVRGQSNRTVWEGTLKYYFNLVAKSFKPMGQICIT